MIETDKLKIRSKARQSLLQGGRFSANEGDEVCCFEEVLHHYVYDPLTQDDTADADASTSSAKADESST